MNPPLVCLDGFRFLKVSYSPPRRFFHELLKFGQTLQDAGVTIVIVDNDSKAHSTIVRDEWAKFGIDVWSGVGVVGDRDLISEFTGEDADKLGGFPVNSPDCMVLDQSVNNSWKNLAAGLNDTFQNQKPSQKTKGVSSTI